MRARRSANEERAAERRSHPALERGAIARVEREDGWAALDVRVRSQDQTVAEAEVRSGFVLRLQSGAEIEVDAVSGSLEECRWTVVRAGTWADVATDPAAQFLGPLKIAPYLATTLELRGFRIGERVEVEHSGLAGVPGNAGGYRDRQELGRRAEATRLRAPPSRPYTSAPTQRKPIWHFFLLGLLCLVVSAAVVLVLVSEKPLRYFVAGAWISFALAGAWALMFRFVGHAQVFPRALVWRPSPQFSDVERGRQVSESIASRPGIVEGAIFVMTNGAFAMTVVWAGIRHEPFIVDGLGVAVIAVIAYGLAGTIAAHGFFSFRANRDLLEALLGHRPVPGWTSASGRVHGAAQGPVLQITVDVDEAMQGPRTIHTMTREINCPGEINVSTVSGVTWHVCMEGARYACWHSICVSSRRRNHWELTQTVGEGDNVIIAGYLNDAEPKAKAESPGSLLLAFTPAGVEPRKAVILARRLGSSWIFIISMEVLIFAGTAISTLIS